MTAFELRIHLRRHHDLHLIGLDYAALLATHDDEHRSGAGHDHDDGPGSVEWARECQEFGCDAGVARVAVLEYMVLAAVVLLAWLVYWAAR